ncbi:MAG: hypothetical protein UY50_C0024G0020 [Parcubacteria group bacterium GW2011_GWA2_49_9]|nr:MAG: hypothetical protein UY50_C0024G0020 [Parcubacteria group bacterium GW2011_GWA2_49_9]
MIGLASLLSVAHTSAAEITPSISIIIPILIEQVYPNQVRCIFQTVKGEWYVHEYATDMAHWTTDYSFQAHGSQFVSRETKTMNMMFFRIRPFVPQSPTQTAFR